MNCNYCKKTYNLSRTVPHLLSKCGHSMCWECINIKFHNGRITCTKCALTTFIETTSEIPRNLTILEIIAENDREFEAMSVDINERGHASENHNLVPISESEQRFMANNPDRRLDFVHSPKEHSKHSIGAHLKRMSQIGEQKCPNNFEGQKNDKSWKLNSVDFNSSNFDFASQVAEREMCPVHQRTIEAYCFKDGCFLCLNCLIENGHQGHRISDLESAYYLAETEIKNKLTAFSEDEKLNCEFLNQKAETALQTIDGNFYYAKKKVELFFSEMVNLINERKCEIINQIS